MIIHFPFLKYLLLPALLFSAMNLIRCTQAPEQPDSFDIEKARGEITSRLRAYEEAMSTGNKTAFANMYTEDAEIFHDGGHSTIGRENIVKTFEGWVRDSVVGEFASTGLWGNEELLVEQGTGYFAHATGRWKSTGKYLLVWKNVDGQWQIFKDTWFSDPKEEE
jgi:ketosteroid isomerase-like protein